MADRTTPGVVRRTTPAVVTALLVLTSLPALLRRMAEEFDSQGGLQRATTGWMYAGYAAYATLHAAALSAGGRSSTQASKAVGGGLVAAGALCCLGGMSRFSGPAQVSGLSGGTFVTDGIYALTRNPQYLGCLTLLAGGAVARRSAPALVLTGAAAVVLDRWIPVEERYLRRVHGSAYDEYAAHVSRWPASSKFRSLWRGGHLGSQQVGSSA